MSDKEQSIPKGDGRWLIDVIKEGGIWRDPDTEQAEARVKRGLRHRASQREICPGCLQEVEPGEGLLVGDVTYHNEYCLDVVDEL